MVFDVIVLRELVIFSLIYLNIVGFDDGIVNVF